jgi:hypothetical protein
MVFVALFPTSCVSLLLPQKSPLLCCVVLCCTWLCALCSVLCALCSVLCALCSVLCALCSVLCALCSVLPVVGTSVVITMGINIISPHIQFILHQVASCCKHTKGAFSRLMTQQQADKVEKYPVASSGLLCPAVLVVMAAVPCCALLCPPVPSCTLLC